MKYTPEELSILKNLNAISEEEYQNKLNAIQPKTSSFNLDKVNSQIEEAKDSLKESSVTGILANKLSTSFGDELPKGLLTAGKALGLGSQDWYNQQIAKQEAEALQTQQELSKAAQQSTTAKVGEFIGGIGSTVLPTLAAGAVGTALAGPVGGIAAGTAVGTAIGAGQDTAEFEQRKRQELEAKNALLPSTQQLTPQQIQQQIDKQTTDQFLKSAALEGISNVAGLGIASKIGKQSLKYLPAMGKAAAIDAPLGAVSGALSEQIIGGGLEAGADTGLAVEKALLGGVAGGALSGGFAGLGVRGERANVLKEARTGQERLIEGQQEFVASNPLVEDVANQRLEFLNKKETGNISYELRDVFNANGELVKNRKQIFGVVKQEQPQVDTTTQETVITPENIIETPLNVTQENIIPNVFEQTQETVVNQDIKNKAITSLDDINQINLDTELTPSEKSNLIKETLVNKGLTIDDIKNNIDLNNDTLTPNQIKSYTDLTTIENKQKAGLNNDEIKNELEYVSAVKKSSNDINKLDDGQNIIKTENLNENNVITYKNKEGLETEQILNVFKSDLASSGKSLGNVPVVDPIAVGGKYKIKEGRLFTSKDDNGNGVVSTFATLKSFLDDNIKDIQNTYKNLTNNSEINLVFNNKASFIKRDNQTKQVGAIEVWSGKNRIGIINNPDVVNFINDSVKTGYADTVRAGFVWEKVPKGKKTYNATDAGTVSINGERYRPKIVMQYTLPKDKSVDDVTFNAIKNNKLTEDMLVAKTQAQIKQEKELSKQPKLQEKEDKAKTIAEKKAQREALKVKKEQEVQNKQLELKAREDSVASLYEMVKNDTYKDNKDFNEKLSKYANKSVVNGLSKGNKELRDSLKSIIKENNKPLYDTLFKGEDTQLEIAAKNKAEIDAKKEKAKQDAENKLAEAKKLKEIKKEEKQPKEKQVIKETQPKEIKEEQKVQEVKTNQEEVKQEVKTEEPKVEKLITEEEELSNYVDNIMKDYKNEDDLISNDEYRNNVDFFNLVNKYKDDKNFINGLKEYYGEDVRTYAEKIVSVLNKEERIAKEKTLSEKTVEKLTDQYFRMEENPDYGIYTSAVKDFDNKIASGADLIDLVRLDSNEVSNNIKQENVKKEYSEIKQDLSPIDKKIRAENNTNIKKVKEVKGSVISETTNINQLKKEVNNEALVNSIKSKIELMQKGDTVVPNINIVFDYKGKTHSEENSKVVNKIKSQKQKNVAGALLTDENGNESIYLNIENIKKLITEDPQFNGMTVNDYAEYVYSHETGHTKINKLFDNDNDFKLFVEKNAKGKILNSLFELKKKDYPGVSEITLWKEVFSDFLGGRMISADKKGNIKVKTIAEFVEEFKNYKTSDAKTLLNTFKNAVNDIIGKKIFKSKTEGDNIKDLMDQFQRIAESKSDYTNSKRDSQVGKKYSTYINDLAKIEYSLFPTSVLSASKNKSMKEATSVLGDILSNIGIGFKTVGQKVSKNIKQVDIRANSDKDFGKGYKVVTDMENMLEQITKVLDLKAGNIKNLIQESRKNKETEKSLNKINKVIGEISKNISKNKEIPSFDKLVKDYNLTLKEAESVDDLLNIHINGQKNKKKAELINIGNENRLINDVDFDNKFRNIDEYSIDEVYNYLTKEIAININKIDKLQNLKTKKADINEINKLSEEVRSIPDKQTLLSVQKRLDNTFTKSKEFEIIQVPHGTWYINIIDKSNNKLKQVFFEQYSNDFSVNVALKKLKAQYGNTDRFIIEKNKIDRSVDKLNDPTQKVNQYIKEWTNNELGGFDYLRNAFNSIDELSRQTAVFMYNERINNIAEDLSKANNSETGIDIKKLKDNVLRREGNILSSVRGATSVLTLGFNFASALINLSNIGLVLPGSAARYNSFDSYGKAVKLFSDTNLLKVLAKGTDQEAFDYIVKKLAKNPTEAAVLKDLYMSGMLLGTGNYDIRAARNAIDSTAFTRGIEKYIDLSMKPFSITEKMNRIVTTSMFMDIANKQNITNRNEIRLFLRDNIHRTQGNYNKSGRPAFLGGDLGALIWQFKQFPQTIIGKFLSTGIGAFKGNKEDMKEFGVILAAYVMLAGVKGLPLIDDIDDLYNGISKHAGNYDADLKGSLKDVLSNNALTRTLYNGIFSADTGLGMIDISQNLSLGKFTPALGALDPTNKNRFKTLWEVLGPAGVKYSAMPIDLIDGVSNLSMYQTLRALPISAVNNVLQGTGALITDNYLAKSGKLQTTTGNEFEDQYVAPLLKTIGFNPSRLTKTQELITDAYTIDGNKKYATQNANRKAAEGDLTKANEIIKDWNSRYPNNKIKLDKNAIERVKKNIELEDDAFDRFTRSANKDLAKIVRQKQEEAGLED